MASMKVYYQEYQKGIIIANYWSQGQSHGLASNAQRKNMKSQVYHSTEKVIINNWYVTSDYQRFQQKLEIPTLSVSVSRHGFFFCWDLFFCICPARPECFQGSLHVWLGRLKKRKKKKSHVRITRVLDIRNSWEVQRNNLEGSVLKYSKIEGHVSKSIL